MKSVGEFSEVYLHTGVLDMRLGVDRLAEKVKSELERSVIAGGLFVFISRSRRKIKLLYWDRDGYAIWLKRLEQGVFKVESKEGYESITGVDLDKLLSGLDLSRIKLQRAAEQGLYA
jgi:transposase